MGRRAGLVISCAPAVRVNTATIRHSALVMVFGFGCDYK